MGTSIVKYAGKVKQTRFFGRSGEPPINIYYIEESGPNAKEREMGTSACEPRASASTLSLSLST